MAAKLHTQSWIEPAGQSGGGDFVISIRRAHSWRVIMGDVSGHGDKVAELARTARLRIARDIFAPINERRLRQWNRDLQDLLEGGFVCLTYLEADLQRGELIIANAGNPAVLIRRESGQVDSFPGTGLIVGLLDDEEWLAPQFVKTSLSRADRILCFTDGLTEQFSPDREPFGLERVIRIASQACTSPVRMIRRYVRSFVRNTQSQDDVTVLMLQAG